MHLAFISRGAKEWQDRFINELSTRYLPTKRYNKETKKLETRWQQIRLCPIQLFDVCFPEEHFDSVATTIFTKNGNTKGMGSRQKLIWALRKGMGFKEIPEFKTDQMLTMNTPDHLENIGIGIKEDIWLTEDGRQVKKSEKTDLSYEGI